MAFGFPMLVVFRTWLLGFPGWLLGGLSRALVPRFRAGLLGFRGCLFESLDGLFPMDDGGLFRGFGALFLVLNVGFSYSLFK
ncbi:hypothetical protein MA16_Dca010297 [Dendrobium catenatum]|uniref:Uncharacterized protein n=1 Tax=Dendrobium catenatum TaxID=906689 RepID=A0A2I0W3D6_9ASPA|nr:hypothetical protein MA16_Dca010297 [Dendrobium catenatum]